MARGEVYINSFPLFRQFSQTLPDSIYVIDGHLLVFLIIYHRPEIFGMLLIYKKFINVLDTIYKLLYCLIGNYYMWRRYIM